MEQDESYGLEEVQSLLLQAILEFDKICRSNGIRYSLHGGTLLGAERNHRFIPWDDDADVSMTRADYAAFRKVLENAPGAFTLDEKTLWVPRFVMKNGNEAVCVDILIWDSISSNKVAQKAKITLLRFYQGLMKGKVDYKQYRWFYRPLLFITQMLGRIRTFENKKKRYAYLCEHAFTGDGTLIHRANDSFVGLAHIYDAGFMKEYVDIMFEGSPFMANKRYKEFLVRSFGKDYLTPPPAEERVPAHENIRKSVG